MKEINIQKILIFNFILFNIFKRLIQQEICNANINCNNCNKCQIGQNSEVPCEYGNLFCNINQNNLLFFTELKSSYIDYFSQNSEIQNICGEQNIKITRTNSIKLIDIGNKNENYLKNKSLHCFYSINYLLDDENDINILISLSSQNNANNKLSFSLYFNFANTHNLYYTDDEIRNADGNIKIIGIKTFNIMLDINKITTEEIKENLIIEIILKSNNDKINKHDKNSKLPTEIKENSSSSKKKDYKLYYILFSIGVVIIVVVVIILKICLKRRLLRIDESNNLNRREINIYIERKREIETKEKLELLFNTKLYPAKYFKNISENNNNTCSICLEYFIENKSIISLTPCKHIFHYECLRKWAEGNFEHFKCPNCNYDFLKENEENIIINVTKKKQNENNIMSRNNNINSYNNYIFSMTNRNNFNFDTLRSNNNLIIRNNNG